MTSLLLTAKKDIKRSRILDAAKRRFAHFGIKATTMLDIAREADIAVGTIYKFFPDKDALILAWVDEHRQLLQSQFESVLVQSLPADEKLRRFLLVRFETVKAIREVPAITELTRAVLRLTPQTIVEMTQTVHTLIEAILEEGRVTGCLPSVEPKADTEVLFLALAGFFASAPDPIAPPLTEDNMLRVVNWFIAQWKLPLL
jgi:TetR/AcrR family transcriptional regulator